MNNYAIPSGFVALSDIAPKVLQELRYATAFNFIGRPVDGYAANRAYLSREAADALRAASEDAGKQGYLLKVYDGYRPQRAVDHFNRWVLDAADTRMKKWFYPDVEKADLYALDFLGRRSSHSRGSAVDLTLFDMLEGRDADMGGPFDFFGPISHFHCDILTSAQAERRALLRQIMTERGFAPLESEWWHFRLIDEPFPDTWFDFVII
ncbi:MAG: M15 family metallopeptidase [Clostridia bacterium]|nr:M15 family metallopeptidase [Clostridia bacterium]